MDVLTKFSDDVNNMYLFCKIMKKNRAIYIHKKVLTCKKMQFFSDRELIGLKFLGNFQQTNKFLQKTPLLRDTLLSL